MKTNNEKPGLAINGNSISSKVFYTLVGLLILFSIATIVLAAVTLGVAVNRLNEKNTTNSLDNSGPLSYADQIKIEDLLHHLEQLQVIADQSQGTRAIGTRGFNGTLEYITQQLEQYTDFIIRHEYFPVPNCVVQGTPQLQSQVNGLISDHVYLTDFAHMIFSPGTNFDSFVPLVVIPNLGCQESDWTSVSVANSIALVKRGVCTFPEKSELAEKYRARALLMYNDGTASDRFDAFRNVRGHMNMTIPGYFLSYNLGMKFVDLASNSSTNIGIKMKIDVEGAEAIGNICADTPTGSTTKTIIVGSHSDGVLDGSGINDNGSGSVGNLVLALNLARLLKTSSESYAQFSNRVRFCWWGAEELGLLGSIYHVQQAALPSATIESGRVQDYLLYFNYDMLASPNSNFGILDSLAVPPGTPTEALPGTDRITGLFQQWFNDQKLPWTRSGIGGGSDFVPFLTQGIASGGVNTGAGGIKSADERDQYAALLGMGNGGLANIPYDSCYHQQCDRIKNVNPFAYEKAVKAAAYAIEYTARLDDLEKWLYPNGRTKSNELLNKNQFYNSPYDFDLF
ncbi:unnamed protein product [Rotaria magnacalcarata]|uniref:Peptide hydrolase n=1 Tax=Rotaria magnacalcarata TaxID=392030 RepID=A0A815SAS5_9BILA|nr:unnamed protein product [Rotaria magnacalcarata]CAF2139682.1 unnamed protein product [Rotaria magnacalcarata]CAF3859431.1 unnamed protein product [Rotaria magnacalcarata]CAF3956605.1 unnamed protein product [Rotaria magnacalcarata]